MTYRLDNNVKNLKTKNYTKYTVQYIMPIMFDERPTSTKY